MVAMKYREELEKTPNLQNDVLCYWEMVGEVIEEDGVFSRYIPKGQIVLVFNFGDRMEYNVGNRNLAANASVIVVPASATSGLLKQFGRISLFGISLIGEGIYKLFHQPIAAIIKEIPEPHTSLFNQLHKRLANKSFSDRINITRSLLSEHIDLDIGSPIFQKAIKMIDEEKGRLPVSEVAAGVGVSERQLQRLFKTRMGLTPKAYSKIARVNNYLNYILSNDGAVDFMDLVVENNYHDQPHLIREVKSVALLSPKKLQQYRDTLYHRYLND